MFHINHNQLKIICDLTKVRVKVRFFYPDFFPDGHPVIIRSRENNRDELTAKCLIFWRQVECRDNYN